MLQLLDNIAWHTLTGAQARFAAGSGGARRYARGFSPIIGFMEPGRPDFAALAPHCDEGEHFYCDGWSGAMPAGWHVEAETTELGDYLGVFDDGRLVAMAGERMHAATLREISGVCTHPQHQGRGLARRLMLELVRRQLQRGETPFLHVMRDNVGAHTLYQRMGFSDHCDSVVRVVARKPG
jgi:ribosomal protein S18 acetylase RimI-like enzyme